MMIEDTQKNKRESFIAQKKHIKCLSCFYFIYFFWCKIYLRLEDYKKLLLMFETKNHFY